MRLIDKFVLGGCLLLTQAVFAHGPTPVPLQRVPVPPVPGLVDGADPIVVNKDMAIALGKALFWDVNVGSDGMACGSCHFHAGADRRVKNQINPGLKSALPSGQTFETMPSGGGGANYTLSKSDFPIHRFNNPLDKASGVAFSSDDVVSSAGTFSGNFSGASKFAGMNDECARAADPIFHVDSTGTRRVEPRNAPTVINAIFNHRNFWDGRANNIYNGSSPWGDRDADAGVWVKTGALSVAKRRLHLENSALASLAMGPALSDLEMSCRQRKWPDIGRKLLSRQPLQNQKVHYEDSVLAPFSLSAIGNLKPGLNTTYKSLISRAFNQKYWAYSGVGPFGAPAGQPAYNQMEANFSMFFGIALQLYQATLISDQAPFDLSPRNSQLRPTWQGMGKTTEEIASLTNGGNVFFNNHCNLCHTGPTMSLAAVAANAALLAPVAGKSFGPDNALIPYGPDAFGPGNAAAAAGMTQYVNVVTRDFNTEIQPKLMDMGYTNTGVGDPDADPGVAGTDDFGNPLSFSAQYVAYLLENASGVRDSVVNTIRSCDFIAALAIDIDYADPNYFTSQDGIVADGSREGVLRDQNCADVTTAYIPSAVSAAAALSGPKMAVAAKAAFKIPTLRNIELTGPYMHNGSMATLEQVMEFYARRGNVDNDDLHFQLSGISLANSSKNRADLIAFLKTFTDDRVRYEKAPFDHPELTIPNGHVGDHQFVTPGSPLNAALAKEETMTIPAVGANGSSSPLLPFDSYLAP